jgi:hypothetical protein
VFGLLGRLRHVHTGPKLPILSQKWRFRKVDRDRGPYLRIREICRLSTAS